MDWRQSDTCELIRLYEQNVCLWDYHDQDYKNQIVRNKAWAKLANYFDKDVDEIKKKIKHLRNSYLCEKKKVNKMKGRKIPYEPHLYYYNYMSFLDPVQVARVIPKIEKDHQWPVRPPTITISHNGSFESPKRKRSYSSDNFLEPQQEHDGEEQVQQLQEDEMDGEKNDTASIGPPFKESPKGSTCIEIRRLQAIPAPKQTIPPAQHEAKAAQPMLSKEDTFCAMICSELRLLKSEETYDNVTAEIFIALKNAKAADRKLFANS